MNITFLDLFDQFRFMGGTIFAHLVFVVHTVPKKENFKFRSMIGFLLCIIFSMTYLPILQFLRISETNIFVAVAGSTWWLFASLLTIVYIMYCFEITLNYAMFRCILGLALQQVITVILRYCIVGMWFPEFPQQYPIAYAVVTIMIYLLFYWLGYVIIAQKMQTTERLFFLDSRKMRYIYIFLILAFSVLSDITMGIFELLLASISSYGELSFVKTVLEYFCIMVILLICTVIFLIQYNIYEISSLRMETEILNRIQKEKEKQYLFSKNNIDIINQKSHDLKHHIQALKLADDSQRKKIIDDTKQAIDFYDSVIKTDDEVLNVILTEKNLVCLKNNIKLSCSINTRKLGDIGVVDLYSILGNALDNAIECVNQYNQIEKKVISIAILEKGNMLCIFIDNFFDGKLQFKDGIPITSKKDTANHGYGVKSIRMLARKYGGDIRISVLHNTFSLQVMIPV
jgi:hypothetical protein